MGIDTCRVARALDGGPGPLRIRTR
jgi:hypothetical protein